MGEEYFKKALSNFTQDMANGGAIRHLWDLGYSIRQIKEQLDYPVSFEKIQEVVWNHLLNTGVICYDKPGNGSQEKVTYVKEYDKYGRTSFRKVLEVEHSQEKNEYIACDFGLLMYRDKKLFQKMLDALDDKQREYITDIPWARQRVYHRADEPMKGIAERLRCYEITD